MSEIWKDIKGYEGHYKVSNTGKVYSCKKQRVISQSQGKQYYSVQLWKKGEAKNKLVHRLVAEAFVPNPENKPEVNHIDHNPHNNNANNLEWVTHEENAEAYFKSEKYKNHLETQYIREIQTSIKPRDRKPRKKYIKNVTRFHIEFYPRDEDIKKRLEEITEPKTTYIKRLIREDIAKDKD